MVKKAVNKITPLVETMHELIWSAQDVQKKLASAAASLAMSRQSNDRVNAILEKWKKDIKSSEKIVLSVQADIDRMIHTQDE